MSEEELYKLILEGGSGANPSDTATFVEDENGNLILMFTSDKMTTSDQQANSTLNAIFRWLNMLVLTGCMAS